MKRATSVPAERRYPSDALPGHYTTTLGINNIPFSWSRLRIAGLTILLFLIWLAFLMAVAPIAYENTRSSDWDQRDYLKIGLWISQGGDLSDGNRNPLYPLLLAPFARRDIGYFTTAKLISMGTGIIGLLTIYAIARRYVGSAGGLAVVLLVALNNEYRQAAGYVDVEVLLVPLFFAAWHSATTAAQAITTGHRDNLKWALAAGIISGLCYLAKGTGIALLAIFILTLIFLQGVGWIRHRAAWLFVLGFSLAALPLWLHNLSHYGNPFYNVNTTHYMWLNSWENNYVYSVDELPTIVTYWQTHTVAEVLERLGNGLRLAPRQWYGAVRPGDFPTAPWASLAGAMAGLIVFGAVTRQVLLKWPARRAWFLLSVSGILCFTLLFAWYHPIDRAPRFVLPWAPILYLASLWLLRQLLERRYQRWYSAGLVSVCLVIAIYLLLERVGDLKLLEAMPAHDRQVNQNAVHFMHEVIKRTTPGERFIIGPTHAQAEWLAFDRESLSIPHVRQNWPTFNTWLLDKDVRYVLLDEESWERRQLLLDDYWTLTDQGLVASETPPGWTLVSPSSYPCTTCLFAFNRQAFVPDRQVDIVYETAARMFGYTLDPAAPAADEPVTLILYWQLLQRLSETTHVFVHLLDSSGELVAQHDGQLLLDLRYYPDEEFMAGTIVQDVHPLLPLPAGVYSMRIGLYHWQTQERLVATQPGNTTPSSYLELLQLSVR